MVAACRKLVGHFRHSAKATSALLAAQGSVKHACLQLERLELGQAKDQHEHQEPQPTGAAATQTSSSAAKKPIQDVSTRWNSTYHMLVRALLLRVPILQVLSDKKISNRADILLDLSAAQWAVAEDLVKALHDHPL